MNRSSNRLVALLLTMLVTATGCHPTQPFYLHEDGDLSHYLETATEMENPDIEEVSLEEVTQARPPLTLTDTQFDHFRDVTLEECVTIALQNSKVIRNLGSLTQFTVADGLIGRTAGSTTVYDPAVFETDPQFGVEAALSEFDAQFTTNVFWEATDRPQNSSFPGLFTNQFRRDYGQFDAGLSKRTATGTTWQVRNQTIYDANNNPSRELPSDWYTAMDIEATQPLLRNLGTQVNRAPVVLARIRVDISLADFEAAVRNMVQDLENSYWDLHFAYRFLETAKIGRDSALVTWRNQYETLDIGAGTAQQEAQSREQYFFFRSQMETALRDLLAAENRLRWLMGISPTDGELLRTVDRPTLARVDFDWAAAHTESIARTAELRRQRWSVKQRETELILARNQLLPQLDLVGRYRWLGMGDELIVSPRRGIDYLNPDTGLPQSGSVAWDSLTDGKYQEFRFGLQFTPPRIGARQELAGVRNAELNLAREKARLEDMELNTSHLLTTAMQNLDFHYRNAQTHFNRWAAAEKEVEALMALVKGGKGTVDLVLDGQRRRASAQADFYRAIVEYNKAIAHVHFRKGSLLEYNNITLAEGPWPKKAYWDALGRARQRDASYYLDYGWTRPRVISQGPTDQGGEQGMIEEWQAGGVDMEQIPTPTPATPDSGMPMDEPMDLEPMDMNPSFDQPDMGVPAMGDPAFNSQHPSIFQGPDLGLDDDAPRQLRQPSGDRQAMRHSLSDGVQQTQHLAPVATPPSGLRN